MKLGFIGLGRMGKNMVLNLQSKNHKVVVFNRHTGKVRAMVKKGSIGAYSLQELVKKLPQPRVIIFMISAGKPVDIVMKQLLPLLSKNDIIIEAGNSWFEDSIRRSEVCKRRGIKFLDMGTSGGLAGARYGASLMIGGEKAVFNKLEPVFKDIAAKDGYGYMGPAGSGHFVKMVHNGIGNCFLAFFMHFIMGSINFQLCSVSAQLVNNDLSPIITAAIRVSYASGALIPNAAL